MHIGRFSRLLDDEHWLGRIMLAPAVIYIALLIGVPFLLALFYSVSDITTGTRTMRFVGLKNFRGRADHSDLQNGLAEHLYFCLRVANPGVDTRQNSRAHPGERLSGQVAYALSHSVAVGGAHLSGEYRLVVDPGFDLQCGELDTPGQWDCSRRNARLMWLGTPELAMTSIITVHVWRLLPLATVILLAGLTSIPQDIHDAAAVDGAGFWRHLFQITIPLVAPIMTVAVLFGFIFAFTDMIVIYVLTRGGPYHSTQVLASLAFFTGIDGGDLAEGAAISLFLFPLLVAVAFLFLRLARRTEVV